MNLATESVEQIRRRGDVHHLHVVFAAELQEPLGAGAGMLGPLTLIAMRQQHYQPAHAQPFNFTAGNKLIDDHLRAVGKIAELRFPQGERGRFRERIAVFKTKHGQLRQRGVMHLVARLRGGDMVERRVAFFRGLVDQHRMAMREGAALGILSR